jgi:hypothetical protein
MGIYRTNNPLEYDEVDGIVIDEKAPSPNVQGVGTGVVCLVGQFQRGPQKLDRISSITDLQERYGKSSYLGNIQLKNKKFASLKVVRVVASDAAKAQIIADDGATTDLLQFDAKDKGAYGNSLSVTIEAGTTSGKKITIKDKTSESVLTDEIYDNYLIADGVAPFSSSKIVDVTLLASTAEPALASETSLAGGSDGTLADTDYESALALAQGERACNVLFLDEYNSVRNQYLKTHASLTQDRMVICGVSETADVSAVLTEAGTLRDTEGRIILAYNWVSTLVNGAATYTSPASWLASILSQTAPQIDPANANNITFMFGALELKQNLNREDYKALMAGGVCAMELDEDLGGIKPKSGIVTQVANSSKLTILRRRMADYLTNSIGLFLKLYQNDVNSASKRNEVKGSILSFIQSQENLGILPKDSEVSGGNAKVVDVESLNTDASIAAGQFKIQYKQRIYSSMRFIVLVAEIGESVVVTEGE